MARIVIEDLPVLATLTEEEMARIFGAGKKGSYRPSFEALEDRLMMAAKITASFEPFSGTLKVTGTNQADKIIVRQSGQHINVIGQAGSGTMNSVLIRLPGRWAGTLTTSQVRNIEIDGKGGDDNINVSSVKIFDFRRPNSSFVKIWGGEGNDIIRGSKNADTIYGGGGWDYIYGGDGKDYLIGGEGNDFLYGGLGDDYLDGGRGVNILFGEGGKDRLINGSELGNPLTDALNVGNGFFVQYYQNGAVYAAGDMSTTFLIRKDGGIDVNTGSGFGLLGDGNEYLKKKLKDLSEGSRQIMDGWTRGETNGNIDPGDVNDAIISTETAILMKLNNNYKEVRDGFIRENGGNQKAFFCSLEFAAYAGPLVLGTEGAMAYIGGAKSLLDSAGRLASRFGKEMVAYRQWVQDNYPQEAGEILNHPERYLKFVHKEVKFADAAHVGFGIVITNKPVSTGGGITGNIAISTSGQSSATVPNSNAPSVSGAPNPGLIKPGAIAITFE